MLIRGQLEPAKIRLSEVFGGLLELWGVTEHIARDTEPGKAQCLTDGEGAYLWVYADEAGMVTTLTRQFMIPMTVNLHDALVEAFGVDIVSEYQPEFWGFATNEEWEVAQEEIAKVHEREFEIDLMKYLRGEPNGIQPDTVGMVKAEIGRKLVEENPNLMSESLRSELMAEIETIFTRDHTVTVPPLDDD